MAYAGPPLEPPQRSEWGRVVVLLAAVGLLGLALAARPLLKAQLIELEMVADASWKEVEVQLQRQHELLPKLVQVVKGYQAYEAGVIDKVLAADREFAEADSRNRPAAARNLDGALHTLMLVTQRFPALAANQQYRDLAYEIAGTKNRIAVARGRYNDAVAVLNARRRQFPWSLVGDSVPARTFYDPPAETQVDPQLDI